MLLLKMKYEVEMKKYSHNEPLSFRSARVLFVKSPQDSCQQDNSAGERVPEKGPPKYILLKVI